MRRRIPRTPVLALLALLTAALPAGAASPDDEVIRLRPRTSAPAVEESAETVESPPPPTALVDVTGPRRGFDYQGFEARLESLWFQRKTLLADGRVEDAERQSELIRAFCAEEGVHRLDALASALLVEADRLIEQGYYDRALDSLALAESFDAGRPEIYLARAKVHWKAGHGAVATVDQLARAFGSSLRRSVSDLRLFSQVLLILVVATGACLFLFSLFMLARYQVAFRHEIEEWVGHVFSERWSRALGWVALALPLVLWVPAGWIALYWILVSFRFMRSGERVTAVALLIAGALALPVYRFAIATYGLVADPVVRTTTESAEGEYDPDHIVSLRKLVLAHPDDPVYRFLLAGLYKNGRYYEDAFAEYKEALELDPALEEAHINIGNIFFLTGQYPEAIASYNHAIDIAPSSLLALFNRHLAQSEAFRFKEAEASLAEARSIDSERLTELLAQAGGEEERQTVIDATLGMGSVWEAALVGVGRETHPINGLGQLDPVWVGRQLVNPITIVCLSTLLGCAAMLLFTGGHGPARRCIRCGRPFCHHCKSSREGREYCSQCLHLFVVGDGLAPETKTRKLYEVERHERLARGSRRLVSLVLPGSSQLLRGRAGTGVLLLGVWFAAWIAWQYRALRPLEGWLGIDLPIDLMQPRGLPVAFQVQPLAIVGVAALVVVWFAGNAWRWRGRES